MQILAVVVRYQTPPEDSKTLCGLCSALAAEPELAQAYNLLLWDNSPEPLRNPQLPVPFTARHSERNLGVSGAYNHAMAHALERGIGWMLLLDQDTTVTAAFLRNMLRHSRDLDAQDTIAAIAPTVRMRGAVLSPLRQMFHRHRPYPAGECGIAPGEAMAANSGCLLRVSALAAIGGFSTDFWLDYSDMYVFHQFFVRGFKVWRAADTELEHELAIMDYDRLMTPWRFQNFSEAETAYYDLAKGRLENAVQTLRLFARALKQRKTLENTEYARIAWDQFLYRVRVRRKRRIERWRAAGQQRLGSAGAR